MNTPADPQKSLRNYATAVYVLQAATYGTGVSFFVAALLAYWKRKEAEGTWLESHFRWQINSFWFALAGAGLGAAAYASPLGLGVLAATSIWFVYRIGQGWTRLSRGQPIGGGAARNSV